MRQVQVSATTWHNPVLKDRQVLTVFEPLEQAPVKVEVREDLLPGLADLFGSTAAEGRYLTEGRIARMRETLADRLGDLCFHRTNYWELDPASEFRDVSSGNVFHVDEPHAPARKAFEKLLAEPDRTNLRHFPDLYGFSSTAASSPGPTPWTWTPAARRWRTSTHGPVRAGAASERPYPRHASGAYCAGTERRSVRPSAATSR